jgi:signal transduction histidine kinase
MQSVDYLADKVPEAEKDILRMIRENVARADNIVRTLVDFSRASKLEIKAQDINRILEKSLLLIQHEALNKEIKITRELQEDILLAMVDENKIEQVFVNIFLNAIQAMPKEGELNIRTRSAQETISVEITDTGTGIAEENIKKVFDPFFTTKGPRGGAGLGLAVTRNIIELHRGSIEMQSRVGEGTKVIITLKAKS